MIQVIVGTVLMAIIGVSAGWGAGWLHDDKELSWWLTLPLVLMYCAALSYPSFMFVEAMA